MAPEEKEIVKAGMEAALAPVRDTFSRLLGPIADELSGLVADPLRVYRFKRSVRLLEKVKRIAEDAGIELHAVAPKTLLPILENGSVEDNEELHDRWANLLANAGTADRGIHPAFPDILRQLEPADARFLDLFYEATNQGNYPPVKSWVVSDGFGTWRTLTDLWETAGFTSSMSLTVDNLIRLNLLSREKVVARDESEDARILPSFDHHALTEFGRRFVAACQEPDRSVKP